MNYEQKYKKYKKKYLNLKYGGGIENIPLVGFGTWQSTPDNYNIEIIIINALKVGYRCFDCALAYRNQRGIGKAFKYAFENMGIMREDLFIIGKANSYEDINNSLIQLQLDYFDLALVHHKYMVSNNVWKDFIKLKLDNKTKNIGLSNIYLNKLKEFISWCKTNGYEKPSAIENEINIFNPEIEFVNFCLTNNIKVIAYSPLVQICNTLELFKDNKVLNDIKDKYSISLPQLLLLWLIRKNVIPIPASSNEIHMCENLSILNYVNNPNILNIDEIDLISTSIGINFPVIDTAQQAKEADI